jgi:hypothetical protein
MRKMLQRYIAGGSNLLAGIRGISEVAKDGKAHDFVWEGEAQRDEHAEPRDERGQLCQPAQHAERVARRRHFEPLAVIGEAVEDGEVVGEALVGGGERGRRGGGERGRGGGRGGGGGLAGA